MKDGKIKSMEEIYLFSLPVKEYQIIDIFLPTLKDEVMSIAPVQKQTSAGQRTRFKAFVAVGDFDGHVGLGVKCAKEVATAIRGAIIVAKLSIVPVRRGYWGSHIAEPHTVPCKVGGKSGSVMCRLIPAPRGTGIVAAPACKRMLQMAGIQDCYTQAKGSTATQGNFLKATVAALSKTYQFQSPDLWQIIPPGLSVGFALCFVAFADFSHTTSTPTTCSLLPARLPAVTRSCRVTRCILHMINHGSWFGGLVWRYIWRMLSFHLWPRGRPDGFSDAVTTTAREQITSPRQAANVQMHVTSCTPPQKLSMSTRPDTAFFRCQGANCLLRQVSVKRFVLELACSVDLDHSGAKSHGMGKVCFTGTDCA